MAGEFLGMDVRSRAADGRAWARVRAGPSAPPQCGSEESALRKAVNKQREPGSDSDVLLAVDRERHRDTADVRAELRVPERFASVGVEREEVALVCAAEHESAGRRQQAAEAR